MLGQRPKALNWELGALASILNHICYVNLVQSFSLSGAHFHWLAGLCCLLGFLSPLPVRFL